MTRISHATINVPAQQLLQLTADILRHRGVPLADADYVAWHLVETNLRGTDSHGIARLPHYVRRLDKGSICARPEITFAPRSASTGLLEGGHGLGHVVMKRAVEEAEEMARKAGAGWVAVANSSHCGALAPLGLQLAERGYIGLVFSHVDPMVLPHGAREPFCGTNPICLTAPGDEETTLCLDMATSIVPWNVVANAQQEGVALQEGWAVDGRGNDTTDPHEVQALYRGAFWARHPQDVRRPWRGAPAGRTGGGDRHRPFCGVAGIQKTSDRNGSPPQPAQSRSGRGAGAIPGRARVGNEAPEESRGRSGGAATVCRTQRSG